MNDAQPALARVAARAKLRTNIGNIIYTVVEAAPMSFLADPDRIKYLSEFINPPSRRRRMETTK